MKIKFNVSQDVSTYLDALTEKVQEGMEDHLYDMAEILTYKFIEPLAPKEYNPYLYTSGEQENRWDYNLNDEKSSVTVTYSGSTYKEDRWGEDDFMVWHEFSTEYPKYIWNPFKRHLARDYAYYQETGIDPIAKSKDAKHKGFIRRGVQNSEKRIQNKTAGYLKQILRHM